MLNHLSKDELAALADRIGWFRLTESELSEYTELATAVLDVIDGVDAMGLDFPWGADGAGARVSSVGSRNAGRRPQPDEDPLNAVVRWVEVKDDAASGRLSGKRLALKDSVAVAGVPMTLGSKVLRGFTPLDDSVVTRRLLLAGAEISAIANMDSFAFSGGADTSDYGNIGNPFDPSRSAGGSSGGSAAALYYSSVVDAAIGCDQGGSIRLPAAWCGVVGLKPTHSLVPYTGIAGIDATFDHVGPMARSTRDVAELLLAIAGPDPSDPRQVNASFSQERLLAALGSERDDFEGVRVGVLTEGFSDADDARAQTSSAVRTAAENMASAGAVVEEVSVPAHLRAGGIAFAGFIEGMAALLLGGGNGYHWQGRFSPDLALSLSAGLRMRGDDLPPQIKLVALLGEHLRQDFGGAVYAAAQNQRPWLRAQYDAALKACDVLILPTAPYPAYAHDDTLGIAEKTLRGWEPLANCAPTDMTGHPAISLPVGMVGDLPVGAMLVGRRFEDTALVDLAGRYERRFGWPAPIASLHQQSMGAPSRSL